MSIEKKLFDVNLDQHYFHFVILRNTKSLGLTEYWRHLGGRFIKVKNSEKSHPDFEIQHRKLKTKYTYAGGKLLDSLATSGDSSAPYLYDVFALRVKTDYDTYIVLAFPFAALARHSLDNLMSKLYVRKGVDFRKVDVTSLILSGDNGIGEESFRANVVGLQVINSKDPNLSSVTLGGDNPLKSRLYENFLKESIKKDGKKIFPECCVLACEFHRPHDASVQIVGNKGNVRARVHMDIFGNFKLYVHKGAENIVIIPYLLRELDVMKCLKKVSINPLLRLSKEDVS